MKSGWLKTALAEEKQDEAPVMIQGVLFMTPQQAADYIAENGVQTNPELNSMASDLMSDAIEKRKADFKNGTLGDGEHWVDTVEATTKPDLSKLNHDLKIKSNHRVAK